MLWTNRQYVDMLTYQGGRPMFSELFGLLTGLDKAWAAQGATPEMLDLSAFSFDYTSNILLGATGAIHLAPPKVISEDDDHYLAIDGLGRRMRMDKRTAAIALPETFPVETMDDWLKIKSKFEFAPERITPAMLDEAAERQKNGELIYVTMPGGYDLLRDLMGDENACLAFYDEPELVQDILDTAAATCEQVFERITARLIPDQLSVHEDMAGKTGPLIGPSLVREYLRPYYLRCWEPLKAAGTKVFCQDSDGNMNVLIDPFIEAGVNVFYPCEPAGHMDVVALRKKYGHTISFRGGIDKHVLRGTKAQIDAELDYKLQPCMLEGGIVFGLDHRITDGTPLENYIYYVDGVRERLGLPDWRKCENGWGRMGF